LHQNTFFICCGGKDQIQGENKKQKKWVNKASQGVDWEGGKGGGAWRHASDAAIR